MFRCLVSRIHARTIVPVKHNTVENCGDLGLPIGLVEGAVSFSRRLLSKLFLSKHVDDL